MDQYGLKIAPIWIPTEPTEIRPLVETYNCFTDKKITPVKMYSARYIGLPVAIFDYYAGKYGKSGRDLVKKINQMLSVTPIKSVFTDKITQKMGFRSVLIDAAFTCLKSCGGEPVAAFRFGLVFNDVEEDGIYEMMENGIKWLNRPIGIQIKEILL